MGQLRAEVVQEDCRGRHQVSLAGPSINIGIPSLTRSQSSHRQARGCRRLGRLEPRVLPTNSVGRELQQVGALSHVWIGLVVSRLTTH
jgi:hypothetical protein